MFVLLEGCLGEKDFQNAARNFTAVSGGAERSPWMYMEMNFEMISVSWHQSCTPVVARPRNYVRAHKLLKKKKRPAGPKQAADPDTPDAARIRQEMAEQLVQDEEQDKQQEVKKKKQGTKKQGKKKRPQPKPEAKDH